MRHASKTFGEVTMKSFTTGWLRGDDVGGGRATLNNALQQSVWVYACVTAISEQMAHIPFVFSQGERDGEKIIRQGAVVDLFNRPNEYIDRYLFWDLVVQWLLLRGKIFLVALDKAGMVLPIGDETRRGLTPASLVILNPDRVQKVVTNNELVGYRYFSGADDVLPSQFFLDIDVVCIRTANPFDPWEGLAPLAVAMLAAQTDYAAASFMRGLMANNADMGMIVTTDQTPGPEAIEQMKAVLRERKRSAGTADRPMFLWGGAKIEKPTISMVDMQFLENRKFLRQEVCAVFRVPQEILGFSEDANRAVADAVRLSFIDNRIAPMCQRLEAGVEMIVKAFDASLMGWFDLDSLPIRQAARRLRFAGAAVGFAMGVSRNELNKVFDLGLRTMANGDKEYLPYSLQEVGAEVVAPVLPPGNGTNATDGSDGTNVPPPNDVPPAKAAVDKALALVARATAQHVCGAGSADYAASIKGSEKLKRTVMRNFFVAQQVRVLARIESVKGKAGAPSSAKAIEDIFDLQGEDKILWSRLQKLIRGDLEFGYAQIGAEVGIDTFNVPPADAITWLNQRKDKITGTDGINSNTFNDLKASLQEGLGNGDTMQQLVDRVKGVYTDATDVRAETIATTETNTAINSARQMAIEDAGIERKGWQTSNLEGVRQSHLANESYSNENNGIPLDEIWPNGLRYPSDPEGDPGEVINCRCFGFAVLPGKGVPTKLLRFEEWMAARMAQDGPGGAGPYGEAGGR